MAEEKREPSFNPEQPRPEKPSFDQPEEIIQPEVKEKETKIIPSEKIAEKKPKKTPAVAFPTVKKKIIKPEVKSETLKNIENILSQDLEEIYQNLPDNLRAKFKEEGEETAFKIEGLLNQAKIVVYKIIDLIKNWLAIIPQVNKFFLEQETKIKTERILALKNKKIN
jgi:hypothetical protein